ncbi:MAG: hypothetical protein LH654_05745 [Thermoleophilia bacterium]|nr:hypothetical protein [Thermoleophilia bacterium]
MPRQDGSEQSVDTEGLAAYELPVVEGLEAVDGPAVTAARATRAAVG